MTTNGCCAARSHLRTLSDGFERPTPTPLARLVLPLCGEKLTVSALPACSPLRTHPPRKKRLALFTPELYAAPPPFVNKLAPTNFPQFYIPPSDTKNAPLISPFASPPAAGQKPPQTSRLLLIFNIVAATFARLFQCSRDSTIRSFYARACAHGAVVGACPVEHAERAPPFGTRKSSRAAHWLFFICAHCSARWRRQCGNDTAPVEHAERAPPMGTRKSSRATHCLFFICAHSSTPAA